MTAEGMVLVRVEDRFEDGDPYYTVVVDPDQAEQIKERGERLGFIVRVRMAESFDAVWSFFDNVEGRK